MKPLILAKCLLKKGLKTTREQMELERIQTAPRYTRLQTKILGPEIILVDGLSFYFSYLEIIKKELYAFRTAREDPYIIDGGANIGLSVFFMKKFYPKCRILAFEADPDVFNVLSQNIHSFGFHGVKLANRALWKEETDVTFVPEGADAGRVARYGETEGTNRIQIPAVRLRDYLLEEEVDFLKLDIEGAETEVLLDCSDSLNRVKNLFVEYHSFGNEEQGLDDLLKILKENRFRYQIHTQFASARPLMQREDRSGMDLQLNIFAYRVS